jgi:plastocyanin
MPTPVRPLLPRGLAALALAASASLPLHAATVQVQVLTAAGQALQDAVVLLEPTGAKAALKPAAGVEVGQEGKQFVPAVTVVPVGTRVHFPNRDTVRHHVYSFSDAKKFEIKLYVGKPENPVLFDRAGVVVLGCNIHDSMIGWIIVADTPWHGKTPANGRLQLDEVPAGAYRLRTWHPSLPAGSTGVEQTVQVTAAPAEWTVRMPAGVAR